MENPPSQDGGRTPDGPAGGEPGSGPSPVRRLPEDADPTDRCPICESPLFRVQCKLICQNCGYREDCSDIFPC